MIGLLSGLIAADDVASAISELGTPVTVRGLDDIEPFPVIVDEQYSSILRVVGQDHLDALPHLNGRKALFYLADCDYQRIPKGSTLVYDGHLWSQDMARAELSQGICVMRIILCYTGNNPA